MTARGRTGRSGFAPWWHYVLVLAVANATAQIGLRETDTVTNTISTVAMIVGVFVAMTVLWRTSR